MPDGGHVLLVTARGEVKRCEAAVYAQSHSGGSPAYDVPPGDELVAVVPHGAGDEALLHAASGKTLRIALDAIRPVKSPAAGGVAGMRLDAGDRVVAATLAGPALQLVLHEGGNGKAVPSEEYPVKGRGTGGVASSPTDAPRRAPAGPIAAAAAVEEGGRALVVTLSGAAHVVEATGVEGGRATVSRPLVDVLLGDEVVGAIPLA